MSSADQVNILLVDPFPSSLAQQAMEEAGYRCYRALNSQAAEKLLHERIFQVLVGEIRDKSSDLRVFDRAQEIQPACRSIAVIPSSLEEYLPEILPRTYLHNFVADNHPMNPRELVVTTQKLLSGDIFGIDKYDIPIQGTQEVLSSGEKYPLIERVREFYLGQGVSERVVRNVELIQNELLMNAIFDAPHAADELHPNARRDRFANFNLKDNERPTLSYGLGETHLAVSVSDPFGALDRETFFTYLQRCFVDKSVLEAPEKGAGMGLFLIFKSLDQMVINVNPGRRTEVIALIDRWTTLGDLKRRKHSFHYFQSEGSNNGKEEHHERKVEN